MGNKAYVFYIHGESTTNIFSYYLHGTITHKTKKSSVHHDDFFTNVMIYSNKKLKRLCI